MKTITIKSLELINFKGIAHAEFEFRAQGETIAGRNGSGKTTIFDAFTWVLFGKDSRDRKDFNIKTLNGDGKATAKLPHEVRCVLLVDGREIELRRCFVEKWQKRRGSAVEEFTGHEEQRFVNNVPCSVAEYAAKVNEIVDGTIFKYITNPLYFTSQKADVQREMLIQMAGSITDDEVAGTDAELRGLLDKLTGKTMDEYRKELAAARRKVKAEIETLPARIDERMRDVPQAEDWAALESEIAEKTRQIADIDAQIKSAREAYESAKREQDAVAKEIQEASFAAITRKSELITVLNMSNDELIAKRSELELSLLRAHTERAKLERIISDKQDMIENAQQSRERLLAEWRKIKSETLSINDADMTCPLCGREFDEAKRSEIIDNKVAEFNAAQAAKLERNKREGLAVKTAIEAYMSEIDSMRKRLDEQIAKERDADSALKALPDVRKITSEEIDRAADADDEYRSYLLKERDLKAKLTELSMPDVDELTEGRKIVSESIAELKVRLAVKDVIAQNNKRIAELDAALKDNTQRLADIEAQESLIAKWARTRINLVEDRINSMFRYVKFKMFDTQINGAEVETCEATVSGVPFSDVNRAGQINAGLDIINAISRKYNICAPIIIDNAEAVTHFEATEAQLILLKVAENIELTMIM